WRFFILITCGAVPLALIWHQPLLKWGLLGYDLLLFAAAWWDYHQTEPAEELEVKRHLPRRLLIGAENEVVITISHRLPRQVTFTLKDEYPPELELRGQRVMHATPVRRNEAQPLAPSAKQRREARVSYQLFATARGDYHFGDIVLRWPAPWGLVIKQASLPEAAHVKVYPNIQEAQKYELQARRNRLLQAGLRRMRLRGQGREFESLRDYVPGDELRHVAWTATARRGRLTTRQYQVERNQSIVVMLDAGRLMTSRIERLAKLDYAINAALAIGYVATHGGDNLGLLVFNRQVTTWLPPQRGQAQLSALLEALYNVKAQLIEPSYARAFQYLAQHCKRRSLVIILTDVVDREASAELLGYTETLLPRHLPLIVAIGDDDLRALVARIPRAVEEVYQQSVAEDLLQQREEALACITELGGLALDVPAGQLSLQLVNQYLAVKERGLL
ncbi:MAG: DUF58 domain-containing protein, partial [Deltaproteobacteria bacterium]|nr:DUF58 domain-containing protein [Deltaproteobacteria bacterium]